MATFPQADGAMQFDQQKSVVPSMGDFHVNQLSNGDQNSLNSKSQEAAETDVKVLFPFVVHPAELLEFYTISLRFCLELTIIFDITMIKETKFAIVENS